VVGAIDGPGLALLVGVTHSDAVSTAHRLADKVHRLRIFDPSELGERISAKCLPPGRPTELSAADLGLPVLVVSQFTLYGSTRKGRRPTWDQAAPRDVAEPLVAAVAQRLRDSGARVAEGSFGALMRLELTNDGPFTLMVEVD
jgi:D-aminoacyl-tRNA deacylase